MGTSVSRDLVKFLDVSDNLYIQAYQTRRFTTLSERFTKEAIIAINSRLIASNGIRYFAILSMFLFPMKIAVAKITIADDTK